jgi:hypothetical protein
MIKIPYTPFGIYPIMVHLLMYPFTELDQRSGRNIRREQKFEFGQEQAMHEYLVKDRMVDLTGCYIIVTNVFKFKLVQNRIMYVLLCSLSLTYLKTDLKISRTCKSGGSHYYCGRVRS